MDQNLTVLRNKRGEGTSDFLMEYPCSFCNDYVSQVAVLGVYNICKSCAQKIIDKLDKNKVDNFQKDFEEERAKHEACIC